MSFSIIIIFVRQFYLQIVVRPKIISSITYIDDNIVSKVIKLYYCNPQRTSTLTKPKRTPISVFYINPGLTKPVT